ncbi:unnamed protein product [Hymenolepis diminuta]|uniref:SET domain-containing protein n=1 Tax=Hymenolepis diminuta TaxID=6216 RepID=A0A0R3SGI4_HYMDI|nr:unnamed protein product [Hymenolepis diminuta]VUZ55443.1 unnamed protein product [Hymenolepis diminuta]
MTSPYVPSARLSPNNRVSYRRLHEFSDNDCYDLTPPTNDETQAIVWDRRYGIMFFSEMAIFYGPFSIPSTDEQYVLSQMPYFMQERGKKCQYRIYETYTGVKIGKGGLRVRSRDPATDRVYYFPSHFPNCIILSVLHFDGDSSSTCAVLVYRFKTAEIASRAYTMITETNSIPKRGRSPRLLGMDASSQLSRSSPNRMTVRRTPSNDRNTILRNRSGGVDFQLATHSRLKQSSIDLNGCCRKVSSPTLLKRTGSKRRSNSNYIIKVQKSIPVKSSHQCCYCSACGHRFADNRINIKENPNISPSNMGFFIILNGKRYPMNLFKEIMAQDAEQLPEFQFRKTKSAKQVSRSSSSRSDSVTSSSADETSDQSRHAVVQNHNSESSSESHESVVELVSDKLGKTSKIPESSTIKHGTGDEGIGRNSAAVIRLSRQGYSDSDEDIFDRDHGGNERPTSPSRVIPDGTTVHALYGKLGYAKEDSDSLLGEAL